MAPTARSKTLRFSAGTAEAAASVAATSSASVASSTDTTSPGTNGRASRRATPEGPTTPRATVRGGPLT